MKSFWSAMILGAALLLGGGCIFWQNTVRETEEFDPISGERGAEAPAGLFYGTFRNVSGSDRRFMVRFNGGRIAHAEYTRWLNQPEFLMERAFCHWMPLASAPGDPAEGKQLDCTLDRFDFERGNAVLVADFGLQSKRRNRVIRTEHRVPVNGESSAAMAAAMTTALKQCVEEVRRAISADAADATPGKKTAK